MEASFAAFKPGSLVFECCIEIDKHTSYKNRKRISRGRLFTDPKTKARQNILVLELQERARRVLLDKPLSGPLLSMWVMELNQYWTKSKPRRLNLKAGDVNNLVLGPEDALTKAGIIEDDAWIVGSFNIKKPSPDGINRIKLQLFVANG